MMLEVRGIDTFYGLAHVLHGLSLCVEEGEVVALLGRNGAGKTTTMRSIAGLTPPRSGAIRYKGRDIAGLEAHRVSRLGIALVPETRDIFSYLTAGENLSIARRRESRWQMDNVLERFPSLKQRLSNKGRELSGGEQQMLAIARALMGRPRLLLLDEPSLGLAPLIVKQIFEAIKELNRQGLTVFLVEQNAYHTLKLCDRAYVMVNGRITISGTGKDLLEREDIKAAYLEGSAQKTALQGGP